MGLPSIDPLTAEEMRRLLYPRGYYRTNIRVCLEEVCGDLKKLSRRDGDSNDFELETNDDDGDSCDNDDHKLYASKHKNLPMMLQTKVTAMMKKRKIVIHCTVGS